MKNLKDQLVDDEGLRLKPYKCSAGKLTIGVGHNLDDRGITKRIAMLMLEDDINVAVNEVLSNMPWVAQMTPARQDVVFNMSFNLGIDKLMMFKNTLRFMKEGDYDAAATGMLESKWAGQVGARAQRLAQAMRTGEY